MNPAIITAILSAAASIAAAIVAGRSAQRARAAEGEAERVRQLEERLSLKKFQMYEPMLAALGNMLLPQALQPKRKVSLEDVMADFMNLVVVYGSDEVLSAFTRFRHASGRERVPIPITTRLVADFILAIRRDIGGEATTATGVEVLGMRLNDLYSESEMVDGVSLPLRDLCTRYGWVPPWPQTSTDGGKSWMREHLRIG